MIKNTKDNIKLANGKLAKAIGVLKDAKVSFNDNFEI